jgi:phage tail-like protein
VTALVPAIAAAPAELWLAFDAPVVTPAPDAIDVGARSTPAVPVRPRTVHGQGTRLVIGLDQEMTRAARYEVTVSGVIDTAGAVVPPPFNRASFVGFTPPRPATRRFDLWSMLPRHVRRGDDHGDLARFVAVLQEVTDLLLADIDRWTDILDVERAPERFVDAMLNDLGNPFPFELDLAAKRRLAARLIQMYRLKGTAPGIEDAIRFFLGLESKVIAFATEALTLGEAELGVSWVLGPSERWARYAFDLEVARLLTPDERRVIRNLVNYLKPAHTRLVSIVEPVPVPTPLQWELGVSELGVDTTRLG